MAAIFLYLHVCGESRRDADRSETHAVLPDAVRVHLGETNVINTQTTRRNRVGSAAEDVSVSERLEGNIQENPMTHQTRITTETTFLKMKKFKFNSTGFQKKVRLIKDDGSKQNGMGGNKGFI